MNPWDWFLQFERDAHARNDLDRERMARLYNEGRGFRESDPDRAYALFGEGRRQAERLEEPWWALFYAFWQVEARLFFQRDYRDVLRPAVEAVLEVRKPRYAGFPFRFSIFYDLVSAYMGIDPLGYESELRQTLAGLEGEAAGVNNGGCLLADRYAALAQTLGDWDGAESAVRRMMGHAESLPAGPGRQHFGVNGQSILCNIAFNRGDWERLAEHAAAGEAAARRIDYRMLVAEFQLWQAYLAHRAGDAAAAARLRRLAVAQVGRLKKTPSGNWFKALCAWKLFDEDVAGALRVCDREWKTIRGRGMLAYECYCHVERCRLLARLGRPLEEELAAARAAAGKLRAPAPRLAELDRIQGGDVATGS